MSSGNHKIDIFIESVEVKNKFKLLYNIRKEIDEVKRDNSESDDNKKIDYIKNLRGLQYFIKTGLRPYLLDDKEFKKFEPICEELVEKGQIDKNTLSLFDI